MKNKKQELNFIRFEFCELQDFVDRLPDKSYDLIVGISRGGVIPSCFLAGKLNKPLEIISIKTYETNKPKKSNKVIVNCESLVKSIVLNKEYKSFKKILIVDDIVDSGETLEIAKEQIALSFNKKVKIDSYSIYYKKGAKVKPTYHMKECEMNDWVLFCWS